MDCRESYFSSAEVVNTGSIVLLLSYYCPSGSFLGCEKEGSGVYEGCAGYCILFPTLVIFLQSQKLTLSSVVNPCVYMTALYQKKGHPEREVKRKRKMKKRETFLHFKHVGFSHMFYLKIYGCVNFVILNDN